MAVVAAVVSPAASAASPPAVIQLVSVTTSYRNVDAPPKGTSPGDQQLFTSRLLNARPQFGKPKGAVVGSDRSVLVLLAPSVGRMRTVARLPGGTLTVSGLLTGVGGGRIAIPIVAGTGVFAGARGTLIILKPTDAKTAGNVYRLTYAPIA